MLAGLRRLFHNLATCKPHDRTNDAPYPASCLSFRAYRLAAFLLYSIDQEPHLRGLVNLLIKIKETGEDILNINNSARLSPCLPLSSDLALDTCCSLSSFQGLITSLEFSPEEKQTRMHQSTLLRIWNWKRLHVRLKPIGRQTGSSLIIKDGGLTEQG